MKNSVYIIGLLLSLFFIVLMKNGQFTANEALIMAQNNIYEKDIIPKNLILEKDEYEILISFDVDNFIWKDEFSKIENFIIISDNKTNNGKYKFAFKENFLESEIGFIGQSDFAFSHDVLDEIIRDKILENKKNANIISLKVKAGINENEYIDFSKKFLQKVKGKNLIISASKLSNNENNLIKNFNDDFSKHIILSTDLTQLDRADLINKNSLKLIFHLAKIENIFFNQNKSSDDYFVFDKDGKMPEREIFIKAFGDMMMGRYVRILMDRNGKNYPFEKLIDNNLSFFKGSDLLFANLEGPIKGDGYHSSSSMVFGFPEYVAYKLKDLSFNLLMIANNHSLDQGRAGRDTTISALEEADISWCGHPSEVDPESVYYGNFQGKSIAFICFNDVLMRLDRQKAMDLVKETSSKVDFLIVSAHFGVEYQHTASNNLQVIPSREWIDNGADFVIGHHPHVVQNFEIYNGKFIFYSLGNFIFDQYWSKATQEQLGIGIRLSDEKVVVHLFPMKSEKSQARIMTENEINEWIERFINYGNYSDDLKKQIRSLKIEI